MHKGLSYPYLKEYWQCELLFWPGFAPQEVHLFCPLGYGTSWDRLNAGIVTQFSIADAFDVGDPAWVYIDPANLWEVQLLIHKTGLSPKQYTWGVRIQETGQANASLAFGEMVGPNYVFTDPAWVGVNHFPPFSLGIIPPIRIRPATWSEV